MTVSTLRPSDRLRRIRLDLAREPGHPGGADDIGYEFVAPLDVDGRIDAEAWKRTRDLCGVVRFRPGEDHLKGKLVRRAGGSWAFRYADEGEESGHHFGAERFIPGEYMSLETDAAEHTFKVVTVAPL